MRDQTGTSETETYKIRSPRMSRVSQSLSGVIRKPASKIAQLYYTPSSRILFLRVLVASSLVITAAIVGTVNYMTLTNNERNFAASQYNSISVQALNIMVGSFSRMNKGTLVLAKAYRYHFPNATMWPTVALPGFYDIATDLSAVSSLDNMIFTPVFTPDQRDSVVSFMWDYWANEPGIEGGPGFPSVPLGLWSTNASFNPVTHPESFFYPDITGYIPPSKFITKYQYLMDAVVQMTFSKDVTKFNLGMNGHNDALFGPPLDAMLDCVNASANYTFAQEQCGFFSDIVPLPAPTPEDPTPITQNLQAFIFQPIVLPVEGSNTSQVVGSLTGAVNWQVLLSRAVPSYVNGLDCVVRTTNTAFTYAMVNGVPQFKGIGDLHDPNYNAYARTIDLLSDSKGVASFTSYHLTFYPRRTFFKVYQTDAPLVTSIGAVAIILFCSLVFVAYDISVSRESTRKEVILDTKRRFVRFISHEIRTPLNTVRLGLKLLEMEIEGIAKQVATAPPASAAAMVKDSLTSWMQLTDDILGNSDSAVDVLNDLLNYDKIEMGTLRLEFSSVAIWALVKKTVAAFVMQAKQKSIDLQLIGECWSPDLSVAEREVYDQLRVVGDSTRIAQVLRNLLSNALKFTPEQGQVVVRAEWLTKGLPNVELSVPADQAALLDGPRAGSIRISVTDTGAGLSPQQLAEICSEGVQFNANQLQAGQGSGLGLFISKGLTEQHGGALLVFSEGLGHGSTFRMELPLFRNDQDLTPYGSLRTKPTMSKDSVQLTKAIGAVALGAIAGQTPKALADDCSMHSVHDDDLVAQELSDHTRPKRVLVVDDADSNRKLLMRILKAKGYLCEGACNGQEALDVFADLQQKGDFLDAVLMDYEMPILDGPDATRRLRDMGCACLIVGVTGNVLPADVDHFKRQGANTVLAKPLNIEAFESIFKSFRPSAGGGEASQGNNVSAVHRSVGAGAASSGSGRLARVHPHDIV